MGKINISSIYLKEGIIKVFYIETFCEQANRQTFQNIYRCKYFADIFSNLNLLVLIFNQNSSIIF
jgi:hypothetical protein